MIFFENQLTELEKLYPYKIFFSIGMSVGYFECSICSQDINSSSCVHLSGQLYEGLLAYGKARDVKELDHVSMVANPEDKRCVVSYPDDSLQFKAIRFLSSAIKDHECPILSFERVEESRKPISRSEFPAIRRNDKCFCGSKKKFKKCCLGLNQSEVDHTRLFSKVASPHDAISSDRGF